MPGVGAPAGAFKALANAPEAAMALGGLLAPRVGRLMDRAKDGADLAKTLPEISPRGKAAAEGKMLRQGLMRDVQSPVANAVGETIGNVLPIVAAAKAPQIAGGLLRMGDNAANLSPLNTRSNYQSGMAIFDVRGLPNGGRDLIRSEADGFAKTLTDNGFKVNVEHSGSIAGPSSYLSIYDPETGRFFSKQIRMSGHSKGPFNSQGVLDISTAEEKASVLDEAMKMRGMGPSAQVAADAARQDKTREYWTSIYEKAQGKLAGNQKLSNNEQKAIDWVSKNGGAE
jgi:hypothetical protein